MFSPENRRFTTLLIALVVVAVATLVYVSRIVNTEHARDAYVLTGFSVLVMTQIVAMMRAEQGRGEAKQAREEIKTNVQEIKEKVAEVETKTNGNLTNAIRQVADEVKKAKIEPAPGQEQMPKTPAELQSLLRLFAQGLTQEIARAAAAAAATEAGERAAAAATKLCVDTTLKTLHESGYVIVRKE